MNDVPSNAERLRDLLADKALFELSPEEQAELGDLLAGSTINPDSFEWTAALANVALNPGPHEPLPVELRAKIAAAAPEHLATAQLIAAQRTVTPAKNAVPQKGLRFRETVAWILAAACLFIAYINWSESRADLNPAALARSRAVLMKQGGIIKADWNATADPAAQGATGDVVWNNALQKGFLRFKGLAKNNPNVDQYQLWIFDGKQDERYPIDGGVFNIDSATGDVIVPINPKIRVVDPKMFAVTVEKPGGVVVSDRGRIAVLAKTDG